MDRAVRAPDRYAPLTVEDQARLTRLVQRFKLQEQGWSRRQAAYLLFVRYLVVADDRAPAVEGEA